MYRIELSPGDETAFRSIEELAVAIRRGVVTTHSRIWHNASGKWLPIQFHPHFKLASSMHLTQADLVAGPPVKPLELLTLGEMVDAPAPARPLASEPARAKESGGAQARNKRTPPDDPQPSKKRTPKTPRRPRSGRPLRIALAGALLIGGAHLVFTAASAALAKADVTLGPITRRKLIAAPTETRDRPETTAAGVLPIPQVARSGKATAPPPSKSAIEDDETMLPEYTATEPEPEPRSASLSAELPLAAAPEIQPAPASADIAVPAPVMVESLTTKLVDSTAKKAMKGILRAIGGPAPAPSEKTPAKR
jgi:hypothetical protein